MLNKYPLWKYLLILFVLGLGLLYALPNLFSADHAIQISGASSSTEMTDQNLRTVRAALEKADIPIKGEGEIEASKILIRLQAPKDQLRAQAVLKSTLRDEFVVALNLAPTTPAWLRSIGANPMKLGLDLSGGVHFLLEVDTDAAQKTRMTVYFSDLKRALRKAKILGRVTQKGNDSLNLSFKSEDLREQARAMISDDNAFSSLTRTPSERGGQYILDLTLTESERKEIRDYAVSQNLITLRNRVNELGVAEPLVVKQGINRIVVELPGVQDTAEAKRIMGKTANLEFRLEARADDSMASKEEFEFRNPERGELSAFLEREIVVTGERVTNAQPSFDPDTGQPQVNISLDSQGGALMHRATRTNVKRRLGVLFVERKARSVYDDAGKLVRTDRYDEKKIISLATIQSALGSQFRTTGLESAAAASEFALLLRAGALAAPMEFVEERTVGPSLGAENIALGVRAVQIGLVLVLVFMLLYYRVFGLAADLALAVNLVLLVAVMSIMSATLTLPGIAGIVLTVGMAVDANVLIFARIREELKNGLTPQAAINAGYERAFVTILDANLTTLLVAIILYAVGTGPVKGFAVTLSIGIITSMFTAIMGTRALINMIYGGRRLERLAI